MKTESTFLEIYDVCIIGGGPAGLIVALEYTRLNPDRKVLLVEYGEKNQSLQNELDDSIEIENKLNHHSPYECTNKGLGGTSITWGGRCVMYDDVDFMDRQVLEGDCTWDNSLLKEIKDYVQISADYFECGDAVFNLNDMPEFRDQRIAENFVEGIVTDSVLERWSMPTRFGKRYKKEIFQRRNLSVIQGFEARNFGSPDPDGEVSVLTVRSTRDKRLMEVKALTFIIAAGTQETTRLLLRNKQLFKNLKTIPCALGKYYQGHLSGKIASVRFKGDPKKTDYGFIRDADGVYLRRRFQFSKDFLIKQNLLNTAIWLDNPLYFEPKHRSGTMSLMYLIMLIPFLGKRLAPPAIADSITKGKVNGVSKHLWNIVRGLPGSLTTTANIFYKRYCLKRKLPGVFLFSPLNFYALHFHSEQIPVASNRIELGPDGEKLIIHYELSEVDIESVIKLHEVLDNWLRKCECGELEYWYPQNELAQAIRQMSRDGIHQSGTTRIANSPEEGVVDDDLKLWGTKNVFVCSSSVFPISGQANPTFLLGAFAVRLAGYLTKKNN